MEVLVQSPTSENFDFMSSGSMSSPYLSAPSSPKRFGEFYLSAPASPSRLSQLYTEFDYFSSVSNSVSDSVPTDNSDDGFAFFVNRESDMSSRSAEELFQGGKIKPLKAEKDEDETFKSKTEFYSVSETEQKRGRERDRTQIAVLTSSNSGRRVARSHSPYRKSNHTWELEQEQVQQPRSNKLEDNSGSGSKSSRRWSFKDFLLFRSASEGRASSKDPLKKFYKKGEEVKGSSSFRSSDSSRRKGHVGAHELHYAMKRAESRDLKKKTFLPYRQGILGRLAGFGL